MRPRVEEAFASMSGSRPAQAADPDKAVFHVKQSVCDKAPMFHVKQNVNHFDPLSFLR